ncbi:MAG: hypothetical protein J0H99_16605, partial [Rhodospirillales bacterium]|nr:hypothetical protein [Rhodospirillales bacterium]
MTEIKVVAGDILAVPADVLVLKFAGARYGVDETVATILEAWQPRPLKEGESQLVEHTSSRIRAQKVLFIGVADLHNFRYREIREFGREIISVGSRLASSPEIIATTLHGTNYGLDEQEAFLALYQGIIDGLAEFDHRIKEVLIVEREASLAKRLKRYASRPFLLQHKPPNTKQNKPLHTLQNSLSIELPVGELSEAKPHIFVAMPFADVYRDEWEIGIQEAVQEIDYLCERLDATPYIGDVLQRIKDRIDTCGLVIALLTGANTNVYLEIGYAWGRGKPTVLLVKKGDSVSFDVRG